MSSAEPQVLVARAAVARVLGIDPSTLRGDSPLVPLGWDSLACICWTDAIGEAGAGVIVLLMRPLPGSADADVLPPPTGGMDLRTYGIGAQILKDLGVGRMRLLAQPRKMPSMTGFDLEVTGYLLPSKNGAQ